MKKKDERLVVQVWRNGFSRELQVCIAEAGGHGYRLAGPKFDGSSRLLLERNVSEYDAAMIRQYLDRAFPANKEGG